MPLEAQFRKPIEAKWTHTTLKDTRKVVFEDKSHGLLFKGSRGMRMEQVLEKFIEAAK